MTLSDEAKEKLRSIGIEPEKVITTTIRCTAGDGRNRPSCGKHIATSYQEAVGRVFRLDHGPHGHVTPNHDHERAFPDQRWFDIHCDKHGIVNTLPVSVDTAYS